MMHICRYYHDDLLPEEIRQELEDAVFHALYGDEQTGQAALSRTATADPQATSDEAGPRHTPISRTLERLLTVTDLTNYTDANERLSERLAHEAVHWVGHRWDEIGEDPDLNKEADALEAIVSRASSSGGETIEQLVETVLSYRPELKAVTRAASQPIEGSALRDSPHEQRRREADLQARHEYLIKQWKARHERAVANHQERELGRAIGQFVRELQQVVPQLAEKQRLVRDVFGNEDALFDLSRHQWEELPVEGLEQAAEMLREHEEIKRLAETVGRSQAVSERHHVHRTERRVREREVGAGKAEIVGVRNGADIGSLMPSEVALLADPVTRELFYARLAKHELLVLDYKQRRVVQDVVERPAWVEEDILVPRGPVIVCVDTSGSMLGLPEKIAKAVVLALAQRLEPDRRRIEVLAFATEVRSFSLDFGTNGIEELSSFLAGGFHGGTDLSRALVQSLDLLETDEARYADVLVISDFKVPKIADRHIGRIGRQHRRGTLFHSLTVSSSSVIDPLHIFDTTWLFDTRSGRISEDAFRRL
jgi:uncharacterized protein with von Willebrand factor type A (vWA) domain